MRCVLLREDPIQICCLVLLYLVFVGWIFHIRSKGLLTDLWVSFEGSFVWEWFGSFGVLTLMLGGHESSFNLWHNRSLVDP